MVLRKTLASWDCVCSCMHGWGREGHHSWLLTGRAVASPFADGKDYHGQWCALAWECPNPLTGLQGLGQKCMSKNVYKLHKLTICRPMACNLGPHPWSATLCHDNIWHVICTGFVATCSVLWLVSAVIVGFIVLDWLRLFCFQSHPKALVKPWQLQKVEHAIRHNKTVDRILKMLLT